MSPQESRLLWFFLEAGQKPYSIDNISIHTNVDLLKAAIQQRIKILHDIDPDDLNLSKLNVVVPIDPDDSLARRLASLGSIDAYSRKLSSGQRVGALFPEPHSEDNLHIIVQCSADGLDQPRYDNTPADSILNFYEKFWGVPLPQEHTSLKNSVHDPNDEENDQGNGGENGGDVLPATPPPIIETDWTRLLIRAEYLRIYKWVEDRYMVGKVYRPSAVVVTGQPGIGKTFWAYYVLRRRLGEKSVFLWYKGSMLYLFCSKGVLIVPPTFAFNKFSPPVWTIIDSAQSPSGIPSTLTHFPPGVFPIYITSPRPDRWSGIMQSWTFHQVIMNPWTRAEIEYATILNSDQGLDDVLQRYDSLGPTARFCFELTPDEVARHISDRDSAIDSTSPDLFKKLFSSSSRLSLDTFSDKICLIRRMRGSALGDGRVTTDLISVAVEQQVVQRLGAFSDDQLLDMWTKFSKFGDARGMTCSIFEVFIHRRFRTRIDLDATPMVRSNGANSRWHTSFSTKRPHAATVHGVAQQVFSLQVDVGSAFVYDATTKLSIRPDVYYVPRSGQQVALNSFILHEGYLESDSRRVSVHWAPRSQHQGWP